jgi:hypothetical protein
MKTAIALKTAMGLAIGTLFVSGSVLADDIVWNYNGQATATGQANPPGPPGCSGFNNDTFIATAGNDLSVTFTNMNVNLNTATDPNSGRKNCRLVIPALIAKGLYLASLQQKLTWAIQKTGGSIGQVESRARFSFWNLNRINVTKGPNDVGIFNESTDATPNLIPVVNPSFTWCILDKDFTGTLVVDVSANALRSNPTQVISTFVDGYDARWDALVGIQKCEI